MKKLVQGIVDFRKNKIEAYRQRFGFLAQGQSPDTLFIACSDSRVVPNLFASTNPGDLFVIRNVGNLIPKCGESGYSLADESEAAAIEFAIANLGVRHVIICGHSECGAMAAILDGRDKLSAPHLKSWLRHGEESIFSEAISESDLSACNLLSQKNVLRQLDHLMTYPMVSERVLNGQLKLHGWWFELKNADVYAYEADQNKFVLIDENEAQKILNQIE